MKATELLRDQHDQVDQLFEQIEAAEDEGEKCRIFEQLAGFLVAHDAIEREIFYPMCEEKMGMTELLGEALVEHGLVEFSLYNADRAQGQASFDFKCTVLKEVIEHHVNEEEGELLPNAEKALGAELLEELGSKMQARFKEAKKQDFRVPLYENLRQVLAGATKTTPKDVAKKPASKDDARNGKAHSGAQARR